MTTTGCQEKKNCNLFNKIILIIFLAPFTLQAVFSRSSAKEERKELAFFRVETELRKATK